MAEIIGNITLIGSSHISQQSIEEVKQTIESSHPDIIAIELDRARLSTLFDKKRKSNIKDAFRVGFKGYLFALLGAWAEKKLGELVGVTPGDEMRVAVQLAKKLNIPLALIDQDIEITLKRFSKTFGWKERFNFVADIVKAGLKKDKSLPFDIKTVPNEDTIEKLLETVKNRYPNVYIALVVDRNHVMVQNIRKLGEKKIVAIVGAGHVKGMKRLLTREPKISYTLTIGSKQKIINTEANNI